MAITWDKPADSKVEWDAEDYADAKKLAAQPAPRSYEAGDEVSESGVPFDPTVPSPEYKTFKKTLQGRSFLERADQGLATEFNGLKDLFTGNQRSLQEQAGIKRAVDEDPAALMGATVGSGVKLIPEAAAYMLGGPAVGAVLPAAARSVAGRVLTAAARRALPSVLGGGMAGATAEGMEGRNPAGGIVPGMVTGPVAELLGAGVMGTARGARDFMGGPDVAAGKRMRSMFGEGQTRVPDRTQAAIDQLRNVVDNPDTVLRQQPTLLDAASAETPEFGALYNKWRNKPNGARILQVEEQNTNNLRNVLDENAQFGRKGQSQYGERNAPPSIAEANRTAATRPDFQQANFDRVPITQDVRNILYDPLVGDTHRAARGEFRTLREAARRNGERFPAHGRVNQAGELTDMSVQEMDMFRNQLSSEANAAFKRGDSSRGTVLRQQARDIEQLTRNASTQYGAARDNFLANSPAVNTSHIMADVADQTFPNGVYSPNNITAELNNEGRIITRAGETIGTNGSEIPYQQLSGAVHPDQMEVVNALRTKAQRDVNRTQLPNGQGMLPNEGSETAGVVRKLTPPWFSSLTTAARQAAKTAGDYISFRAEGATGRAAHDPAAILRMLETRPPSETDRIISILDSLRRPTQGAYTGAKTEGDITRLEESK